jgi:hypothetical protein
MTNLLRAFSIGVTSLALAAMFDASAIVNATDTSSQTTPAKHQVRKDRRYIRAATPVDDGYYYDRPVAYRPYPYVLPAPFPFGIGFDPLW